MKVEAEGPKRCLMALVGEAPGQTEELTGKPFVGSSGSILNTKLHLVGISRHDCYVTNLVKVRPPGNDFSIYWTGNRPTPALIYAREALLEEIQVLQTNIIVALGSNALWALTGERKIGKWRGSILEVTLPNGVPIKVIGTYHPAAVLRQWSLGTILQYDLKKAKKESMYPQVSRVQREFLISPTSKEVHEFLDQAKGKLEVAFDIETSPSAITCISLAFDPRHAISIPTTTHYWGSVRLLHEILSKINWVLTLPSIVKVGQNMTFDIQYLLRFFGILPTKPWFDTMLAQHACYSELPKGLDFLTSIYTNDPYYKDDLKTWQSGTASDQLLWEYNARDSAITLEVKHELFLELRSHGETTVNTFEYMMELLEPLLFMMLRGVRVDKRKMDEYKRSLTLSANNREKAFKERFGDVNPQSPKQMANLAYNTLGLKPITKSGKVTMDKKAIEKLSKKSPELREVLTIREERKLVSTYLDIPLDPIDDRLRCSYNSCGTETGRLSSSRSVFWSGTNLQNVPKRIRDIVVPDPGNVFTEADLKGAEAMVVAYLTEDPILIRLFEEGINIHEHTAQMMFGVGVDEIREDKKVCSGLGTPNDSMYSKAKRIRHGGNYLASWKTISDILEVPAKEAKLLLQRFYDGSPNLVKWHKEVEAKIKKDRTLITPLGRKRIFFDRIGPKLFREAVAYIPQETVAHVLNLGLINIYDNLCKDHQDIEILLQVHDSILLQHPKEKTSMVHEALHKLMRVDLEIESKSFHIPIEISYGENWRDLKDVE